MRQKSARIEIGGVAAGRLHDGDAVGGNVIAEKRRGGYSIFEIVLVERLVKADGDGIQIASREPAIRWKTFRENQQIFFLLGKDIVVGAEKSADVDEPIFLRGHGAAVGKRKHFAGDCGGGLVGINGFAEFYEVRVFSEAASVGGKGSV